MTRTKAEAPPNPAIKRLVDGFHRRHVDRHGVPPLRPNYPRFAKDVKDMLTSASEAEIAALMDEFFWSRDPRVVRSDYLPADFVRLAQHLRLRRADSRMDARTVENLDAAERAMGRRR